MRSLLLWPISEFEVLVKNINIFTFRCQKWDQKIASNNASKLGMCRIPWDWQWWMVPRLGSVIKYFYFHFLLLTFSLNCRKKSIKQCVRVRDASRSEESGSGGWSPGLATSRPKQTLIDQLVPSATLPCTGMFKHTGSEESPVQKITSAQVHQWKSTPEKVHRLRKAPV